MNRAGRAGGSGGTPRSGGWPFVVAGAAIVAVAACRAPDASHRASATTVATEIDVGADAVASNAPPSASFECPFAILPTTSLPSTTKASLPRPLAWSPTKPAAYPISKEVAALLPGRELIRWSEAIGWPAPKTLELRAGGKQIGYWPNIAVESITPSHDRLALTQNVLPSGRQIQIVDVATGATKPLPIDSCTIGGAQWSSSGRLITYGPSSSPMMGDKETLFCVLDSTLNVIARLRGDIGWADFDLGIIAEVGTLPRAPKVFYEFGPGAIRTFHLETLSCESFVFDYETADLSAAPRFDLLDFTPESPTIHLQEVGAGIKTITAKLVGRSR